MSLRIANWLKARAQSTFNWFLLTAALLIVLLVFQVGFPEPSKESQRELLSFAVNFLAGGVISFLFYFLVVYLPENRRRKIVKQNLRSSYRRIKKDILWQVVFASIAGGRRDLETTAESVDDLMQVKAFKEKFQHGREADEGFYAFENQMMERTYEFRQIIVGLTILAKQIDFVLHNYAIDNQDVFDFLRRLESFLVTLQHLEPGYDESEKLTGFIWEIFTGFNVIDGDRGYDFVEKLIDDM